LARGGGAGKSGEINELKKRQHGSKEELPTPPYKDEFVKRSQAAKKTNVVFLNPDIGDGLSNLNMTSVPAEACLGAGRILHWADGG